MKTIRLNERTINILLAHDYDLGSTTDDEEYNLYERAIEQLSTPKEGICKLDDDVYADVMNKLMWYAEAYWTLEEELDK